LSSLAYLKNLPATELKIDKAFVLDIGESQRDSMLVRSTIDLGHSLGMKVTAEGVETETALSLLALMGCDAAQGYFIGRPMPLEKLFDFLKSYPDRAMQIAPASSLAVAGTLRSIHS
jgi:EAL domain-containing protein (putative c-di-GMP-specific phosphodiesterase class I)